MDIVSTANDEWPGLLDFVHAGRQMVAIFNNIPKYVNIKMQLIVMTKTFHKDLIA